MASTTNMRTVLTEPGYYRDCYVSPYKAELFDGGDYIFLAYPS